MTTDTHRLRRLLRAALLLPLAGSVTCSPEPRVPACAPSGKWCTAAESAASIATPTAETEQGCPRDIMWNYSAEGRPVLPDLPDTWGGGQLDPTATQERRRSGSAGACCYNWGQPCPGGRPLLSDDGPVVATPRAGSGWGRRRFPPGSGVAPDIAQELARGWLADAMTEHASVAAFARAALELMAVGAPARLVAEAQRAALDEIEHCELCLALAARWGNEGLEPGPLPLVSTRAGDVAALAGASFDEGCAGETVAALAAMRAASACADPIERGALERIAADEARHAALAWRTIAWALQVDHAPVREVLLQRRSAFQRAEPAARRPADAAATDEALLARHGRLGPSALAAVQLEAWREIIAPTLDELLAQHAEPAAGEVARWV